MNTEQKYKGTLNYYGEIHELWTTTRSEAKARRNFITRMIDTLDLDPYDGRTILNCYFNGDKDNMKIERIEG
jgi:hypothetical protein